MKNYLLKQTKKGISVILAAIMLMTCWVFVAPDKAEAQDAGTYPWKLTWEDDDDHGMKNASFSVTVYQRSNSGTGSESTLATQNVGSEALNTTSEKIICSGTTSAGYFPHKFYIPAFKNNNTTDDCYDNWRLYVNNTVIAQVRVDHNDGVTTAAQTITCADGNFPYLNSLNFTAANTNTSKNATTAAASIQVGTMILRDQYGTNLYVNSLTSSSSYNGANITTSITAKSDKNETVNTSYCYASNNNNTSNVTNYLYYKAFPTAQKATNYTVSSIGYSVSWRGYKQTKTQSASWTGTLTINNPYTNITYNAQGNIGEPDNTVYGSASGAMNAQIGSSSSLSTRIYYYWDVNDGDKPDDKATTASNYTKRDYYTFKYYTTAADSSTPAVYITHIGNAEDTMVGDVLVPGQGYNQTGHEGYIDNTIPYSNGIKMGTESASIFPNGSTHANSKTYYGWWEPNHYTVTFINADGNQLYRNTEQDADHQARYVGTIPTYQGGGSTFSSYAFAGWINLNTGELISGHGTTGLLGTTQYVYEDVTYMAYYTATIKDNYEVYFDRNGDGTIDPSAGDTVDSTGNNYYDKVHRVTNVPTLTGEVFDTGVYYDWVDAGITVSRGTIDYNDNGFTITSTANDCYTGYSPWMEVVPGATYNFSFNAQDLAGNDFKGNDGSNAGENTVQMFFFFNYPTAHINPHTDSSFSTPGTCTGTFTVPSDRSHVSIRLDANDAGNIVRFSDIRIWKEDQTYTKASTAEVDYSNPRWVNMEDGSELTANTRILKDEQKYKVLFDETPVRYSLTLVTGSNNAGVSPQADGSYKTNAQGDGIVVEENDIYTWADTITLPNPGNFADGVYDYQFAGWVDSAGNVKSAGYSLYKNVNDMYNDEYVRSDGLNENGRDTMVYYAKYTRTGKTYTVNFVDDTGTEIPGKSWSDEYLETLPVAAPADQTKVDTLEANNPLRYTYNFLGWDNTKTAAIETYSGNYLNSYYVSNGVEADATYKPVFEATYHYYVSYQNADGTPITWQPDWFTYGEVIQTNHLPENNGVELVTPPETQIYTYEVGDWETAVGAKLVPGTTTVTGDITYIAQLEQTYQKYDVFFYYEDGAPAGAAYQVTYGSRPEASAVPDVAKDQTAQYTYTFMGWDDMSTPNIVENYAEDGLRVVNGIQNYRAVFREERRPYEITFKVPGDVNYSDAPNSIIGSNYTIYEWMDSGITYNASWLPRFFLNDRVIAPSATPTLTGGATTGYEIQFVGWFTEPNGSGEQLGRTTRMLGVESPDTYYAHFEYVGINYSVQFFEEVGIAAPFYTIPVIAYGESATDEAAIAAEFLEPYYNDSNNHYTFDGWVLADGTTSAGASLASVTGALKVYAKYLQAPHSFSTWVVTTQPTYISAGVETSTCAVCGCQKTQYVNMLEDNIAPTGQIVIKKDRTQNSEVIGTSDSFITDYSASTVHVPNDSVEVQINTADVGLGVKNLYYAVAPGDTPITQAEAMAYNWEAGVTAGEVTKVDIRNAGFTLQGNDNESYIVYVYVVDNAVTWNAGDIVDGVPTTTTPDSNVTYLSSTRVVFDVDLPEITVTNSSGHQNADKSVFCSEADVEVTDSFLVSVAITKDGEPHATGTVADGVCTAHIAEPGVYVVTALDITNKEAVYTFTIQDGHDYDADNDGILEYVRTDPTCTENGYRTYTCAVCSTLEVVDDDPDTTLGHTYDRNGDGVVDEEDYVMDPAPTCEEDGSKVYICTRCGEKDEGSRQTVPALGHNWQLTEEVAATCTEDGYKVYVCANDPTHTYTDNLDALGHSFDTDDDGENDIYLSTPAVCGANAFDTYRCVRYDDCGHSIDIEVPDSALTHEYVSEIIYPATCEHYGVLKYTCEHDDSHVYYEQIPMTEHTWAGVTTVYATCSSDGVSTEICSVCGEASGNTAVIPQEDHDYSPWVLISAATCHAAGSEQRSCRNSVVCGEVETRAIAQLEHIWEFTRTVAPTLWAGGYDLWTCSLCGDTEHRNVTPIIATHTVSVYDEDGATLIGSVGKNSGELLSLEDITAQPLVKTGYTFSKWVYADGSDITWPVTVTEDIAVKASYTINTYTVTWKAGDLADEIDIAEYNTAPSYDGAEPEKAADERYTYEFAGWATQADAEVADVLQTFPAVTVNVTYYAVFSKTGIDYTLTWKHWDGSTITTTAAGYNTMPEAPEVTVNGTEDDSAYYSWNGGWTPQLRLVTGDAEYTATYAATPKMVNIYFFADGAYTTNNANALYNQIYLVGDTFVLPAGPAKAATDQYIYTFNSWQPVADQTATEPGATVTFASNGYKYIATYDARELNYLIKFNDDAGNTIQEQQLLFGAAITPPAAPEKAVPAEDVGKYTYDFAGWKYRAVTYAANELPTVSDDMTFTAVYEKNYNEFTLTFKTWDGAENYGEPRTVIYGDAISYSGPTPFIPRTAQCTYSFVGWATEANSSTALESLGTVTGNTTLYAAFETTVRSYEITFNVDGTAVKRSFDYDSAVAYPADEEGVPPLTKAATAYKTYTFEGWALSADAAPGEVLEELPVVTGAATYYAIFSFVINQHTATWLNGETELCAGTYNYGATPVFEGETPTKATDDGVAGANYTYAFSGWVDQNGEVYAAGAAFGRIVANMTYTAQFEKVYETYTATFKKGAEVVATSADYKYGDPLAVPASPASYDEGEMHYIFAGWSLNGSTVIDLTDVVVTADIEYIAVFTETPFATVTITFMNGAEEFESFAVLPGTAIKPRRTSPPTKASEAVDEHYYKFLGWTPVENDAAQIVADWNAVTATENSTYYAVFEKVYHEYSIIFRTETGNFISLAKYRYGEVPVEPTPPVKPDTNTATYSFAGWSTTKGGTAVENLSVAGAQTYYAVYDSTEKKYTVSFVNGEVLVQTVANYKYGDALIQPEEDPEREPDPGHTYEFVRWSPSVPASVTKDATYFAQYRTINRVFTVTFYDVEVDGNHRLYSSRDYLYTDLLIQPDDPTRFDTAQYDYTFLGWALKDDDDNNIVTLPGTVTESAEYKAVYDTQVKEYTVAFNSYDASEISTQTVVYGSFAAAPEAPVKPEDNTYTYTFAGWNDGTATVPAADIATKAVVGNVTYTAAYTPVYKNYTVTFLDEDGSQIMKKEDYHYNDSVYMPANPTKVLPGQSWTFTGWSSDDGATTYSIVPAVTEDVTYKAVYTGGVNTYTITLYYGDGETSAATYGWNATVDTSGIDTTKSPGIGETYVFLGWSLIENGSANDLLQGGIPAVTESKNYYAVYRVVPNVHYISWVVEGEELALDAEYTTYNYNQAVNLPDNPVKIGITGVCSYTFLGWSTQVGSAAHIVTLNNVKVRADATYYAVFEREDYSYTVEFRFADTNARIGSKLTCNYHDSLAATPHPTRGTVYNDETFKKTTYTFIGWATTPGATAAQYPTSADLPLVETDTPEVTIVYYAVMSAFEEDYTPEYTITFMNGAAVFSTLTVTRGGIPAPEGTPLRAPNANSHFAFKGWVTSSDGTGAVYTVIPEALANATYYAAYNATAHTLVYDDDASYPCSLGGKGLKVWNCSVCGYERTEQPDAVHNFVEQTALRIPASYKSNGTAFLKCSVCGLDKTEIIPKLGRPVTFRVLDQSGNGVPGAMVTVYHGGVAIDAATTAADGSITLYVPIASGNYTIVIDADGYKPATGSIYVDEAGNVTNNTPPLESKYCDCTCHKDSFWSKIFQFFYKILNAIFGAKCCECNTYL